MRIFHGPNNIGGMAGELARAQRALGHEASALCFASPVYGVQGDGEWPAPLVRRSQHNVLLERGAIALAAARFDVFQFYYAQSLDGMALRDVPWLKRLGKKVFFYFCGCDVRDSKAMIRSYRYSTCTECWPMGCSPNRERLIELAQSVDGAFVSTPDNLEFVPGARLLLQPVDFSAIDRLRGRTARTGGAVRIAHAPTDRQKKGTRHIVAAVEQLRAGGAPIELVLIEQSSRAEVLQALADADLVVDQVMAGAYGLLAVEAMALGKPVVCYLREDLVHEYPEPPPIVSASPDTLADALRRLLATRRDWEDFGRRGTNYARRWHDREAVARRLLEAYGA